MANIKRLIGLSDWLTYRLQTTLLDPPEIKLRMKPISGMAPLDVLAQETKDIRASKIIIDAVLDAVEEWDLAIAGVPLPPTPENKRLYLTPLLGMRIENPEALLDADKEPLLGLVLLLYGQTIENFLKN